MAVLVHLTDSGDGGCVLRTTTPKGSDALVAHIYGEEVYPAIGGHQVRLADGTCYCEVTVYDMTAEQVRALLQRSPRFDVEE